MKKTKKNNYDVLRLSFINGLLLLISNSIWFIHEILVAIAASAVLENTVGFTAKNVRSLAFTTLESGLLVMVIYSIAFICNYVFTKIENKKLLYGVTALNIIFIIVSIVRIVHIFIG